MSSKLLTALVLSLSVAACGGGGGGSSPAPVAGGGTGSGSGSGSSGGGAADACGADAQVQFVKDVSESYYYWYDELAEVNAADYSDPAEYLSAIMQPIWTDGTGRDPGFSYLTTIEEDTPVSYTHLTLPTILLV